MVNHSLASVPWLTHDNNRSINNTANIWDLLCARYYFKFAFYGILAFSLVLLLSKHYKNVQGR